eukprot:CAMPEP_0194203936 /NCGR_PEP_ID=MMETSP0156-20130528/3578_1 /TAXON_ID=33649 /ORGANISM="Thalassionema nitzschioides, Strain L26-B" /LENGTH=876 /DNA_ID=CAMNT_0038929799 /DNA_START=77 /DNA_END=2703 /DNA_ORIENTATION=+
MRLECAIDVIHSCVKNAKIWINAMIAGKSCVNPVEALLTCKFCGSALCEECATACAKCGIVLCGRDAKFAVDCDTCKLSYCLVCLASGQKDACIRCHARPSKRMEQLVHLRLKSIYKAFQQSARNNDAHPHLKRAALAAMKNSNKHCEPKVDPALAKAQADAAAAELLAELEEEEQQQRHSTATKSSKKKKKKKKKGKSGVENQQEMQHDEEDNLGQDNIVSKAAEVPTPIQDLPKKLQEKQGSDSNIKDTSKQNENVEALEKPQEQNHIETSVPEAEVKIKTTTPELLTQQQPDPMQTKLCELVSEKNIDGIEELLEKWKGVPGKAVLRKNAKKALKRLKDLNTSDAKQLLKIISTTPKTSTTQETVLEMEPSIVGYVIGKGGQKIRDLMDESGAKVWIDQDSMPAQEPRIVYVSGAKKSVNLAVKMIQDSVKQISKALQQEEDTANSELLNGKNTECIREEITCEARFVPLLIGRRGWTIKHIQDASGAKVDIDQTVTPRSIIVTGTQDSVQAAKRLISSVLAYPHAQPKNEADIDNELFANDESSPPSKFVMTGDIKSIISASSSLSSTPEPSMASSKQGADALMPPPGIVDHTNQRSNPALVQRFSNPFGQHHPLSPLQQQQQQVSNLSHLPPTVGMVGNLQQHPSSITEEQPQQQGMHVPGLLPGGQPRQTPHPPHHLLMKNNVVPQHEMQMQQHTGFLSQINPNEAGMPAQAYVGSLGQVGQAHHGSSGQQDVPASLFFRAPNESRILQDQQTWPEQRFQRQHAQQNNGLANEVKNDSGLGSRMIQSRGIIEGQVANTGLPQASKLHEESNLIDSLFGPSNSGTDPEKMLLASLNHLNVSSSSVPGWDYNNQDKSRLPVMQQPSESRFEW